MHFKLNKSRKILLSICTCLLLVALSLSLFFLFAEEDGNPFVNTAGNLETYSQQLTYLNENYDHENRVIVISKRSIKDENAIASASGFGDMYVFQYSTNAEAQRAFDYYNSLKYATAMMNSVVSTQVDVADDYETDVLDHLSWGSDILGVDSYQDAIEQKYSSQKLPDVYVAVLDSGIDTDNEFLQGRIALEYGISVYKSRLYLNGSSPYDFEDDHMHGTHVAGTIVDLTLPNVKIIPIKVVDGNGLGDIEDLIFGVKYVMHLKETVGLNIVAMNMSLAAGSLGNESTLVFDQAYEKNIMSVVAAGNESYYVEECFPANCPSALTVSALSQNAVYENFPFVAYYSNYGSYVDLCLPGSNILSCVPDGYNYSNDYVFSETGGTYAYLNGTSMATPHASALVALCATYMGDSFTTEKVEKLLKQSTYDLGTPGRDDLFGYGVPSLDLALADRDLTKIPTLTVGEIGKPYHFDGTISVGITNNNPAYRDMNYEIYYTLDGSYPMICGNRQEYNGAITLNKSTHLSFVIYLFDSNGFVRGHSLLYEIEYFKGEDSDKNTKGTGFEINQNGILQKYTSGLQDVVIPEYVNGVKVRELGNNLFFGVNVRSIVCEADVSLANKASVKLEYPIRYCPNLQSVTLGASDVTYAVSHCFNLKELILLNATAISDATFPSFQLGYSYLGSYTAYGCSALKRVVAYKATSVGSYAFNYVKTLKELILPNVNSIFSCAFIECTGLTEVDLPSAMYIYGSAFMDCYNLRTVRSPKLSSIESYAFANCVSLTDIQTETVTKYGEGALYNCVGLTTLDTHAAQTIENKAFGKCSNLTWLDLSNVTSIGTNTMPDCDNLIAIYCGSNKYLIDKSVTWADWIRRFGNLQYLVTDYGYTTRGGLLNNIFWNYKVIDKKYRVFTRTELFTAIFKDENGNEIATKYHVTADPLNPPKCEAYDEYRISYLSWKSETTGAIFNLGEQFYLSADDTFTLMDYNVYYFAYAEQAKKHYAELYQKLTGMIPAANDAVYSAIELACTVNRVGVQTTGMSDKANILKNVNSVIDSAICNLFDNLLLETDSDAVIDIVCNAKSDISTACNNATDIVDLNDIVDSTLNSIAAQRQADLVSAKTDAKNALRERTKDIYDKISVERKATADEIYQKYDSNIDAADVSEYDGIIDACKQEFIIQDGIWALDDLVSDSEDVQILEIVNEAQENIRSLADSDCLTDELQTNVNAIVEQAKSDIEEYLSSKKDPVEPENPNDKKDPDADGGTEPIEPEVPDSGDNSGGGEDPAPQPKPDDGGNADPEPKPDEIIDPGEGKEPADESDNTVAVAVGTTACVVGAGAIGGVAFWFVRRRRRL
ncbi:MAG: leucine-rich repeat protein [Clostridiales bacterium]|nr:leucine-rich repeat protein [Clostridiales bacterium]